MTPFIVPSLLALFLVTRTALCLDHYKHEAHGIMKRMAEADENFEDSDVARIHLVEGRNKKRLIRRDIDAVINACDGLGSWALQLELSSGSMVNLDLNPSGLVDEDTVVSYHTKSGHKEARRGMVDCYFHGHVEDKSGNGWAAVSHCDGLFGFANSPGYRYFLHPIESTRSKRDADEEDYDVHVMWRRSDNSQPSRVTDVIDDYVGPLSRRESSLLIHSTEEDRLNATGFVIEMAMFSDARYCERLQVLFPGREDDFLLTRLAGTQTLFSDQQKVGYEVQIKVKLLEYWKTDPEGYTFKQTLSPNLRSFCDITADKYAHDLLALNTGIAERNNGALGDSYKSSACTRRRCLVMKGLDLNSFVGFTQELGHTLGIKEESTAKCPEEMKTGGFMDNAGSYDFSPCMQFQLKNFLSKEKSKCLFEENAVTNTSHMFLDLPRVFPGQTKSADELCELLAGPGYNFGPSEIPYGSTICKWFLCLNENRTSPEFGRTRYFSAPIGFSCETQSFCDKDGSCKQWSQVHLEAQMASLKNSELDPMWSEWSAEFSDCSRTCGTGIRMRHRECLYTDFNTGAYCQGLPIKAEVCNTEPCAGEPTGGELRQLRGNKVCARFLQGNVTLNLKGEEEYLPIANKIKNRYVDSVFANVHSKSCYISCQRSPSNSKGDIEGVMPDGTVCRDRKRSDYDMARFNIQLRCVRGLCLEMSDCCEQLQEKDECGFCGGNSSRCVTLDFDSLSDVPRKGRAFLTVIPAGSENIDVHIDKGKKNGAALELWSNDSRNIIGVDGQNSRKYNYEWSEAVLFAGTRWSYNQGDGYFRAPGPIREPVVVQAVRLTSPIQKIIVTYAKDVSQTNVE